jgi:LysW-gamma-L-lysine carboxypeptidase
VAFWNHLIHRANEMGGEREFDRLLPTLISFQTMNGELEERARLDVSFRLPPDFDADAFSRDLAASYPEAQLSFSGHERAFRGDRKNALVRAFLRAIRRASGEPRFVLKTGTSDMNVVGPEWGCPIVAYGPGDSALDHTPDEHIRLTEYLKSVEILHGMLKGLKV